jgi:replicative DNA helicase
MATSFEWSLISRVVRTANLRDVLDWGIRSEDFGITQARAMFDVICGLYLNPNTSGTIPAAATLQDSLPEFAVCDNPSETTDFLCQQVRTGYIERELKAACEKAVEEAGGDVGQAVADLAMRARTLTELGTTRNCDIGMVPAMDKLLTTYEQQELGLLRAKFLWPWEVLNRATSGVSDEDYIIFYGRPKQKKSWTLAYMAACTLEQDMKVLVYTKEMRPENLHRRIVACGLRLDYTDLRFGTLPPDQKKLLKEYRDHFDDPSTRGRLVMLDGAEVQAGCDTVGWLQAKVEKHEPDALFVDGLHLLSDGSRREVPDHQRVRNISRELRQLGLRKKIPIIGTIHANRKAAAHSEGNLDEIAYSDAVAQDATVAIRTIAERHQETMAMIMAGSREFKLHGFRIHSVLAQDFTQKEVMEEDDVRQVAERDAEGRAPKKNGTKAKPRAANGDGAPPVEGMDAEQQQLVNQHWKSMGLRH